MIEAKSLNIFIQSISIGERKIIENLSLTLNSGSIQLLKAPNGTGKSVLLSILSGWDEDIVSVEIFGKYSNGHQHFNLLKDIKEYRKYARQRIGYLSHKLFEESLGVKFGEEIAFIINRYKTIPAEIQYTIDYLKANNSMDLLVEKMSKGHRQLMAIVDVLSEYENYELILLDEPTSFLNDKNLECFIQQIQFIARLSNCAIILASNDVRLFNQEFPEIVLAHQAREKKDFFFQKVPDAIKIDSISIIIKGYPLGQSGKLPFYFNEEIKENESVIVVGANGSGKTTFINVCAGIMRIKGTIEHYCGNQRIKIRQLFPNHLSLLFQEPLNYEFRNSPDEILCQLEKFKDSHFFVRLYDEVLSYYSIPKNQNPKTLSSGQLRILWLISMLGWSGRWILDEPDALLDSNSLELFFHLLNIHIANNGTVIIVTHNQELYKKFNFRTIEL